MNPAETPNKPTTPAPNSRWLRKQAAAQHNKFAVQHSLDPELFVWKKGCRKCGGRGFIGVDVQTDKKVPCSCLRRVVRPAEKITEENQADEAKKFMDAVGGPLPKNDQAPAAPAP